MFKPGDYVVCSEYLYKIENGECVELPAGVHIVEAVCGALLQLFEQHSTWPAECIRKATDREHWHIPIDSYDRVRRYKAKAKAAGEQNV